MQKQPIKAIGPHELALGFYVSWQYRKQEMFDEMMKHGDHDFICTHPILIILRQATVLLEFGQYVRNCLVRV